MFAEILFLIILQNAMQWNNIVIRLKIYLSIFIPSFLAFYFASFEKFLFRNLDDYVNNIAYTIGGSLYISLIVFAFAQLRTPLTFKAVSPPPFWGVLLVGLAAFGGRYAALSSTGLDHRSATIEAFWLLPSVEILVGLGGVLYFWFARRKYHFGSVLIHFSRVGGLISNGAQRCLSALKPRFKRVRHHPRFKGILIAGTIFTAVAVHMTYRYSLNDAEKTVSDASIDDDQVTNAAQLSDDQQAFRNFLAQDKLVPRNVDPALLTEVANARANVSTQLDQQVEFGDLARRFGVPVAAVKNDPDVWRQRAKEDNARQEKNLKLNSSDSVEY